MKVHIINTDSGWILGKFANNLYEELNMLGIETTISEKRNSSADVNHHVMFDFVNFLPHPNDTFMIAHVDQNWHIRMLKDRLDKCGMGICMSRDTMNKITAMGLPRNKLAYINPAHDQIIKPRKFNVGITHKCHCDIDFRKRETMLVDIAKGIEPEYFKLIIMGEGWKDIVKEIRELNIEVEYYDTFDRDKYLQIIPNLDYYMFFGMDEGSMGYLDALTAGIKTIVTPQGFHLDAKDGIEYSCETVADYHKAFEDIVKDRKKRVNSVKEWTWLNFAKKHVEIWEYLLGNKDNKELFKNRGLYQDGIFSVFPEDYSVHSFLVNEIQNHDYRRIAGRIITKIKKV